MGISILIVDDDKLLVEKLEETVNWSGIGIDMVFTANNIRQAQKLLEEYPIEMLLCDIDMPQGNGLELLEWIRYKKLDIECTFLSSYANFAYAQMALKLSSREYLLKPISNVDLETALRRVVGIVQEKHQKQKKQEKKGENEKQFWEDLLVQCLQEEYWIERAKKSGYCTPDETFRLILLRVLEIPDKEHYKKEISLYNFVITNIANKNHKGEMMMRKKTKMAWSVALSAAMAAGLLAGCGSNGGTESTSGSTAASSAKTESSASDTTDTSDRPTYKIATVRWTDTWPTDFLHEGVMKEIEDKMNINIDWQVYYNSDWSEQKSLLLASGDLPDAFLGSICLTQADMAQNKSAFLDLTDLIEKDMPNLKAAFEADPELKAVCTSRDGRIYSLPKKLPLRPKVCGDVMCINQEWLDNLGLETPKTYKELEEVLVKFATEDADGDGDPTNEIGITNAASSGLLSGDLRHILSPFGTMVSRDGNYMGLNGEGKPVFMPMEENYKEAVKWMRQLWEEGVVDPEYFTQDGSMQTAKQQADGGSQVGLIFGWTADAQVGPNVNQFKTLEAVEGYDGNHYVEAATNYLDISDRELMISKDCKDPDTLLKWADEFYTDLASLQTFYGTIGSQITDNGDGTYNVDVPSDGSSLDTSAWSNSLRDFGPKYMNEDFYDKVSLPEDQGDGVKLADDAINEKYVDTEKNCGFPMVQYTDEDLSRITAIGTDIYKYVEAQYAHWVVDGGIDDEWDSYIDQLKAMGIDEFLQIQTDAYNAYKENLAK